MSPRGQTSSLTLEDGTCFGVDFTGASGADVMLVTTGEAEGTKVKVGGKSMTVSYEMINLGSGDVAATLEAVVVLFDLKKRCAVTIPDDLRATAQEHVKADFV